MLKENDVLSKRTYSSLTAAGRPTLCADPVHEMDDMSMSKMIGVPFWKTFEFGGVSDRFSVQLWPKIM